MAQKGKIPPNLKDYPIPICLACLYGKQKKRLWSTKPTINSTMTLVATKLDEIILMDVLDSCVPGFVGQKIDKLTNKRYSGACVFVDQFSGLSYSYLLVQKLLPTWWPPRLPF